MKNVVAVVHGYEIHLSPFSNTYWVYDEETNVSKEWKTLRGAIKWCELLRRSHHEKGCMK